MLEPWILWLTVGITSIIIEIFSTKFYLISIGIGAIMASLFAFFGTGIIPQLISFAVISALFFLWIRSISRKTFVYKNGAVDKQSLLGQTATVVRKIESGKSGIVKIKGREWPAVSETDKTLTTDTIVIVTVARDSILVVKEEHD